MSLHDPIPPGCEPACHGCRHRDRSREASLAQKQGYLARTLAPWGPQLEPVACDVGRGSLGYRDRVTLTARWDEQSGWRFGLMRRDELIAIHDCPVHTPRVNALVQHLVATLPEPGALPLAYLHVAGAQATLVVKTRSVATGVLEAVITGLDAIGIEGLWLHCHPSAGRRLFARSGWALVWGHPRSIDPEGCCHGPTAFQQLLPRLHAEAMTRAERHLEPGPGRAILDLYCGIGATLRRWSGAGAAALGVELAGGAVECARLNAPAAEVLRGTCGERLPQMRAWWAGQHGVRTAYVNPPRSGLEPEVCAALAQELRPARLAYLSCSAGTLARDLLILEEGGLAVTVLCPFDFFPLTHHVEVLALLERR